MNPVWLPLDYVLRNWRPGSFDRTWEQEFAARAGDARIGEMWGGFTDHLIPQVLRHGWGCVEPVTLGWDARVWGGRWWRGRVWAGHARLFLAHQVGRAEILADVVPYPERRAGKHGHCAPAAGRAEEATVGETR